jgi:sugar O-acyltransferase (sialic acid O-acetyltransferase NeuD family)
MKPIVIFGIGKIAEAVFYYIKEESPFTVAAFSVDKEYVDVDSKYDLPVIPFEDLETKYPPEEYNMFVALGYQQLNTLRTNKLKEAKEKGYEIVSCVNKRSGILKDTQYGENCFVMHNVSIHPLVKLGDNVFIWSGAVVCHHSTINDNCWLTAGSNIMGGVNLGKNTFVAGNAMIAHSVNTGEYCFIGANSLVTKDLKDEEVIITQPTPSFRLNSKDFLKVSKFD